MIRLATLLLALALPALALLVPAAARADDWLAKTAANLIILDKIRGQPTPITVKVGANTTFGSITVAVRSCDIRPPDQPADATAFIDVTDSRDSAQVFRGWIFQNTPSVSQMEHPVYDVRLAGCV